LGAAEALVLVGFLQHPEAAAVRVDIEHLLGLLVVEHPLNLL
jgi:hypothetical protein